MIEHKPWGEILCAYSNVCVCKKEPHIKRYLALVEADGRKNFSQILFVFFLTTQGCVWREERGFPPFLFPRIVIIPQKKHCQDRLNKKKLYISVWEAICGNIFARGLSMCVSKTLCMCVCTSGSIIQKDLSFWTWCRKDYTHIHKVCW